jgi:hypothetical protein
MAAARPRGCRLMPLDAPSAWPARLRALAARAPALLRRWLASARHAAAPWLAGLRERLARAATGAPSLPAPRRPAAPALLPGTAPDTLARLREQLSEHDARLHSLETELAALRRQQPGAPAVPDDGQVGRPAQRRLDRILTDLGLPLGTPRDGLWLGDPAPRELALRLLSYPGLAQIDPARLAPLQAWLRGLGGARLALILPVLDSKPDEALHEVCYVQGERGKLDYIVAVQRPGLRSGDEVQVKARVSVRAPG